MHLLMRLYVRDRAIEVESYSCVRLHVILTVLMWQLVDVNVRTTVSGTILPAWVFNFFTH